MIVRETIIKVALILGVLSLLYFGFTSVINSPAPQTKPTPVPDKTTQGPKQPGWNASNEKEFIDNCPLKRFNRKVCECALTESQKLYKPEEVEAMYKTYKDTGAIDEKIKPLISKCI